MPADNGDSMELKQFNPEKEDVDWEGLSYSVEHLQNTCFELNEAKGWWRDPQSGLDLLQVIHSPTSRIEELLGSALVSQKLLLIVSEIGEATEGHRKGLMDDKLPHRQMLEAEMADIAIRLFDLAGGLGIKLWEVIPEKLKFNTTREDHKLANRIQDGGKAF